MRRPANNSYMLRLVWGFTIEEAVSATRKPHQYTACAQEGTMVL